MIPSFMDFKELLVQQLSHTDAIQWAILILGVWEVFLAKANNILLYPAGIGATLLSVAVLFKAQLFAESLLNMYYLVMSIYGWWFWISRNDKPPVKITYATQREWVITGFIVVGGSLTLYIILKEFTPSTVPVWDAWVSAAAWAEISAATKTQCRCDSVPIGFGPIGTEWVRAIKLEFFISNPV